MIDIGGLFKKASEKVIGTVVDSIGKAGDRLFTNDEERMKAQAPLDQIKLDITKEINRHIEALEGNVLHEYELQIQSIKNAQDMNTALQTSDKASWLAKNVAYFFDLLMIIAFLIMLFMVFDKQVPEDNKEIFYTGFGLLGSYVGQIMGFHRGTSKGSEDKQKHIEQMISKKPG